MKAFKFIALAAAACLTLCFTSCTKTTADKAAEEHKDQANKKVVVSVVFQPGNAMGEAEKKPIVIKSYTFTPVN